MTDTIQFRPLGILKEILDGLGVEITYAYEDLVFTKHNHFLLKFSDIGEKIYFYQNSEIEDAESATQLEKVTEAAALMGVEISFQGKYRLKENDDETMNLEFFAPLEENP